MLLAINFKFFYWT